MDTLSADTSPIASAMAKVCFVWSFSGLACKLTIRSRDNEYILTSYRYEQNHNRLCLCLMPPSQASSSIFRSLWSIFRLHNETRESLSSVSQTHENCPDWHHNSQHMDPLTWSSYIFSHSIGLLSRVQAAVSHGHL